MSTIALFVDDASVARQALAPLLSAQLSQRLILVACAPKMNLHIGRWLTSAAKEQNRQRWARELFGELQPLWSGAAAGTVETMVAKAPVPAEVFRLRQRIGTQLVTIDARRARAGAPNIPIDGKPVSAAKRWAVPIALTSGLSLAMALAD
jgi:hypothetical protein